MSTNNSSFLGVAGLVLAVGLFACGDDSGGGGVTDAELKAACDNGVTQCKDDPAYGQTFGAQDCSTSAIAEAYAACDSGCRENARPIIECQSAASDCAAFVACVQ